MSHLQHQSASSQIVARCAVFTFSDTRTPETDTGGDLLARLITDAGHVVASRFLLHEEPELVVEHLKKVLALPDVDAILTTGGTGVARRDVTIDAIEKLLDRQLPGFGELFRMLSFQQIGSAAMLSRAIAGIACGKMVFCLPGSPPAVELGFTRLIQPELRHLLGELRK
jgi:molybdenum cofactor biosynthesis protein B